MSSKVTGVCKGLYLPRLRRARLGEMRAKQAGLSRVAVGTFTKGFIEIGFDAALVAIPLSFPSIFMTS
jgi:hypothetical protein